jgi:hypothetical protein
MSDNREEIEVEFTDEELLIYMKMAHEMDITFNEFVELALITMIEQNKSNKCAEFCGDPACSNICLNERK